MIFETILYIQSEVQYLLGSQILSQQERLDPFSHVFHRLNFSVTLKKTFGAQVYTGEHLQKLNKKMFSSIPRFGKDLTGMACGGGGAQAGGCAWTTASGSTRSSFRKLSTSSFVTVPFGPVAVTSLIFTPLPYSYKLQLQQYFRTITFLKKPSFLD